MRLVALLVAADGRGIVAHRLHVEGAEALHLLGLEGVDDGVHLLHGVEAGVLNGDVLVEHEAVLRVNFLQSPPDRLADVGVVADHLGAEHGGDDGVLVARVGAAEVPARLLEAEHEGVRAVLLPLLDLLADELEADGRLEHRDAEVIADGLCHARRDEGLDDGRVLGQRVLLLETGEDVVEKQDADLIARERDELALVVLDGDAEAVGVGVGAEHDVRIDLVRKVDAHRERLFKFGVWHLDGGELGILDGLLLDDGDVDAKRL